jgi:hypothetical protein
MTRPVSEPKRWDFSNRSRKGRPMPPTIEMVLQETIDLLIEIRDYRTKIIWRHRETAVKLNQLLQVTGDLVALLGSVLEGESVGTVSRPDLLEGDLPPELRDLVLRCQTHHSRTFETWNSPGVDGRQGVSSGGRRAELHGSSSV